MSHVTALKTIANYGCTVIGDAKKLEDARNTFKEIAAKGLQGPYVEVEDTFLYSLQVAVPPLGYTSVELIVEELLQKQLREVTFEIPFLMKKLIKLFLICPWRMLSGHQLTFILI